MYEGDENDEFDKQQMLVRCPYVVGDGRVCNRTANSLTAENPTFQLFHANCCRDFILCNADIDNLFYRKAVIKCPMCGADVPKHNFSVHPWNTQRCMFQVKFRGRSIQNTFNKQRSDFGSLTAYNEYLEMVEEIIYDATYGTAEEQKAAEARIVAYQTANQADIVRANARARAALLSSSSSATAAAAATASSTSTQAPVAEPQFRGPQPLHAANSTTFSLSKSAQEKQRLAQDRAQVLAEFPSLAATELEQAILQKQYTRLLLAKRAGGFHHAYSAQRGQSEFQSSLFAVPGEVP